jgi:thiamine biosynthesis lipoprotein
MAVLEHAIEVAKASGGAFDPTLTGGGYQKIRLERGPGRVRLGGAVTLDLGSVAKGHAADRALESLRSQGATAALVDVGTSSVALFGAEELVFHIRNPAGGASPVSFRLRCGAIGSSSEEQQGSHIVDPWTGEPPRKGVLAATVIAPNAAEADALSTAVFVLGEAEGLALLRVRGAEGVLLLEEEGRLVVAPTPEFAKRYALEIAEGVGIR